MGCGGILDCSQLQRSCSYGNLAIKLVRNILVAIQFAIVHASFFQATMLDVTWLKLSCCLYFRLIATTLDQDFFLGQEIESRYKKGLYPPSTITYKGRFWESGSELRKAPEWGNMARKLPLMCGFFPQKFTSLALLFFLGGGCVWHGRNTLSCLAYSE